MYIEPMFLKTILLNTLDSVQNASRHISLEFTTLIELEYWGLNKWRNFEMRFLEVNMNILYFGLNFTEIYSQCINS